MENINRKQNNLGFSYYLNSQNQPFKIPVKVRFTFLNRANSSGQQQQFSIANVIRRSSLQKVLCKLCEMDYPQSEMTCISDCKHNFCVNCMHHYITYKLNVMESVICPEENCAKEIDTRSNCFVALSEDYKNKYNKLQVWKQTISNPNYRLCPEEKCNGIIDIRSTMYKCQSCKIEYCRECMLKRHEGPCDKNFQLNFSNWKRCPKCHMFIQKNEGCNHITCLCSHQFCYLCLADWRYDHQCLQFEVRREFEQMSRWKQIIMGILMVIFFPVYLAIIMIIVVVGIALIIAVCIALGPVIAYSHVCNNMSAVPLFILFYPIIGIVIAIAMLFFLYDKRQQFHRKIRWYWQIIFLLFYPAEIYENNNQDLNW